MAPRRRRHTRIAGLRVVGTATLVAATTLTACSGSAAAQIDYVVDGALVTYNTNTVIGAASAGAQAFARTLTGFGYHGPDGQVVADRDFGTVSVVEGSPLILDYQISDDAVYSDGRPVTCDDLVLAWRPNPAAFPASTLLRRPAMSTSPTSSARRGRKRPGCRSSRIAVSLTTPSCSPRRR